MRLFVREAAGAGLRGRAPPVHPGRGSVCQPPLQTGMRVNSVLIIGGGPAGLRAAEVATAAGARVIVCDGPTFARPKFLVAGRAGLNLTHGEPVEDFPARYIDEPERWRDLLGEFGPDKLRAWAEELGVETYVGTSGRVFPLGQKAAGLLRAWLQRLRAGRVEFQNRSAADQVFRANRMSGARNLELSENPWSLTLRGGSGPRRRFMAGDRLGRSLARYFWRCME